MRFSHPGVQLIDFSPCERYMVTFSPILSTQEDQQQIIIWDIRTGMKKRGFHCETQSTWPILKSVSMMYLFSDNEFDQICLAELDIKEILKMNIFRLQVEQWWKLLWEDYPRYSQCLWNTSKHITNKEDHVNVIFEIQLYVRKMSHH